MSTYPRRDADASGASAVLDQFAKIIPTVLKEEGCHGYAPMVDHAAGVSFQTLAPDSI
ncbi:antibiotic biosynthesis monooxygenase, partial [Salmonella enterica subsp. enterica serovar Montevideo]|nr:antibiotic biosynthesis monooxygenase [Salmonella enterica subsp. enterica serovar Montevideo]